MPRTVNLELRNNLESAIHRSLRSIGLNETSYQSIADEVGISRALVQHYYPRKMDFSLGFLEKTLFAAAKILGIDSYARNAQLSYLDAYRIGCLYYGFLLDENGARPFFFDILKDRELADELMRLHYEWGLKNIDPTRPAYESRSQDVIEAWGGFYELMYCSIKQDFYLDVSVRQIPLLKAFNEGGSKPFPSVELFLAHRPSPAQLDELKAKKFDSYAAVGADASRARTDEQPSSVNQEMAEHDKR